MGDGYKIATGYIQIMPEMKDFTSSLKGSITSTMEEEGTSAGSQFGSGLKKGLAAAGLAAAAAGAAVAAFAKSAVSAGMDFDSSMSQVAATMGTTVDEISELRDFAQEMGRTTAFSATEAADALNYMALAGYDAETSMKMLPTVLDLAAAGGIDLALASDMVTDAQSALGLSLDETSDMVDQMAQTASKSNTSVQQLGEAFLKIGANAQDLKGGTVELSAALGILADSGIKGAEGGTHLRNIILSLQSPTDDAAGMLEQLGVQVFDADGKMNSLNDIMMQMNGTLAGMTEKEKTQAISKIFNKTDLASVKALLGGTKDEFTELYGYLDDYAVLEKEINGIADPFGAQGISVTALKEALAGAASEEEFAKQMMEEYGMSAEQAAYTWEKMADAAKNSSNRFDELTGYIEDATGAAQQMAETQLDNLEGDITLFKSALEGAQIALSDRLTPALRDFVKYGTESISEITAAFQEEGLQGAMEAAGEKLSGLGDMIVEKMPEAAELGTSIVDLLLGVANDIAKQLPDIIGAIVDELPELMETIFTDLGTLAGTLIPGLVETLGNLLMGIPGMLLGAVSGIVTGIGEMFEGIGEAIDEAVAPRFSAEDGAFANTIAAFQSNGEYAFTESANKLKSTWARIIGNTDWQSALDTLSLAQDTLDAVYAEYNSFKAEMDSWSPEAAVANFEIKAGTVTSLVDQITAIVGEGGKTYSVENGALLETLAQQVNDLLGEDVLEVTEDTGISMMIKEMSAELEAGLEDPADYVRKWLEENTGLSETSGDGIPFDVLTALSIEYNSDSLNQATPPEQWIREKVETGQYGEWKEGDLDFVCNLLANDGEVKEAWFSPTNGATADVIKSKYPELSEGVSIDAAVDLILTETENGQKVDESTIDGLIAKLQELAPDEDWETVVAITVSGLEDMEKALESLRQYTIATYAQKTAEMAMDEVIDLKKQWADQEKAYADAMQQYSDAVANSQYGAAETAFQAAQTIRDSLIGMQGTADLASEEYILAMYNMKQASKGGEIATNIQEVDQAFMESMGNVVASMTGFTSSISDVDSQLLEEAQKILDNQGGLFNGWGRLNDEAQKQVALAVSNAQSWDEVAEIVRVTAEDTASMSGFLTDYMQEFGEGVSTSAQDIYDWMLATDGARQKADELGIQYDTLALILSSLAENQDLMVGSTQTSSDALEQAAQEAAGYGEQVSGAADAVLETVDGAMQELAQSPLETGEQWRQNLHQAFEESFAASLENILAGAQEAGYQIPEDIANNITSNGHTAEQAMTAMAQLMENGYDLSGLSEETLSVLQDILEIVDERSPQIPESMAENIADGQQEVTDSTKEIVEGVKQEMNSLPDDIGKTGDDAMAKLVTSFTSCKKDAADAASDVEKAMDDAVSPLAEDMESAGDEGGSNLDSSFGGWKSTVSGTVDEMYNFFYNTLGTTLPSMMNTWGYGAGQKFNSGLQLYLENIKTSSQNIYDGIKEKLKPLPEWMEGIGKDSGSKLRSGLNTWFDSILSLAMTMATGTYNSASFLPDWMYTLGYNAGAGIYNGLAYWENAITNLAFEIASNINAAAKSALNINSPSKVLTETGMYAAQGLSLGIEQGTDEVMDSAEEMARSVVEAAYGMLDMGSAGQDMTGLAGNNIADSLWGIDLSNNYAGNIDDYIADQEDEELDEYMMKVLSLLEVISRMQVVLDTGELVGAIDDRMNAARLQQDRS